MLSVAPTVHHEPRHVRDAESTGASSPESDSELIAAIARGSAAALGEIYLRYRPAAVAAAYALVRERGAAEDVVHDAFLNVWRAAGSFSSSRGAPRGWLLTIVRNAALDHLREQQTARRHQPVLYRSLAEGEGDDVSTTAVLAADARRVRAALSALPPDQRHALELAYFGGLTHGEIAERTGAPLGTVKGRVRLGLRRLRHDLRDLAPDGGGMAPTSMAAA